MRVTHVRIRNVLVTGCSSGIGLATARVLRARGWNVVPTARKTTDCDMLGAEGFTPVELDTADAESVRRAVDKALDLCGGAIGGLVNNAGFEQLGAIEDLTREVLRHQFEVNLFGPHDLIRRLVPTFRRQGWGRIVNISSMLGRVVVPFSGGYSASKFALEALSDALRVELAGSGVGVSLVEPGPIVSRLGTAAAGNARESLDLTHTEHAAHYDRVLRNAGGPEPHDAASRPPEEVAAKIAHALESSRPKIRYCVTVPAYKAAFAARFVPAGVLDAMNVKRFRK